MKIIIVGLGKVGQVLAQALASENHDLIVIDLDKDKVNNVVNYFDVNGICGNGARSDILTQADVQNADILISVTSEDELNILVGMVSKRLGVKYVIARVRNPDYSTQAHFFKENFGFSMIANPKAETAKEISRLILFPTANSIECFAGGKVELVGIRMTKRSKLNGLPLHQLSQVSKRSNVLVCAVRRDNEIIIPSGNFVVQDGDEVYVTGTHRDIALFSLDICIVSKSIKNVMIIGGSRVAFYLSKILLAQGIHVKIIERDQKSCWKLAEALHEATIIQGDGSDENLLLEENIEKTDAFVCLTGMDEENIILSLLAKQLNVKKVIAKVNSTTMYNAVSKLDIDSTISPKQVIANQILGYVRAKVNGDEISAVQTMYQLVDEQVEALEFIVGSKIKYVGMPLSQIPIKDGVLVAAILRGTDIIVPKGDTVIELNDHIVIVVKNRKIAHLNDIFEV